MSAMCGRAQAAFKLHIRRGGEGCKYPKFLAMRAFGQTIVDIGSTDLTSAGPWERTHKDVKIAVPFSNGHHNSILAQVCSGLTALTIMLPCPLPTYIIA